MPQHLLYTIKMWIWPRSCSVGWLFEDFSSSSAMSFLLLVPRGRPDRLTGSSVFQWRRSWSCRWGGGRERVWLSIDAGLEGSSRRKFQRTERKMDVWKINRMIYHFIYLLVLLETLHLLLKTHLIAWTTTAYAFTLLFINVRPSLSSDQ